MSKPLVIVESPAKARTIERLLGDEYRVEASVGHVRDLPQNASEIPAEIKGKWWDDIGVDVDNGFRPYYVEARDKAARIRELKSAVKDATEVLLATDPDREGESISWHLREVLRPSVPVRRIEFHEITREAIRDAIANARDIDHDLVDAQESRRIVDRLVGYMVSPVLWRRVQTGLSAGRVQSVAVRLVVEREEERKRFRSSAYWDLEATIRAPDGSFTARLDRIGDARVAAGRDFDSSTGMLRDEGVRHLDEAAAGELRDALIGALPWAVSSVEERPATQKPAAPFTTSTLQQEANRKLGFSAERTMSAAQRLFADGIISYHRTDSTVLSDRALGEAGTAIRDLYGAEYHDGPRRYRTRVQNAQEAHEAIRPTDFARTPQQIGGMGDDERRLYDLIWKRAVASQMTDAQLLRTSLEIRADGPGGRSIFVASGRTTTFPGYLRAYVEGSDDPAAELGDKETILPRLAVGDRVGGDGRLMLETLDPKQHETTPPPRYTDASLVKRLEDDGIGRPSTYASIISTIERRGYVWRDGKALVPTFTAYAVTKLLTEHFGPLVELGFTGRIEGDLDEIARGTRARDDFLSTFYRGGDDWPGLNGLVERATDIEYPVVSLGTDPDSGGPVVVRIGRFGPYIQVGEGDAAHNASVPEGVAPADLSLERALEVVAARARGPESLGDDPDTNLPVFIMSGRYGPYVQLGPTPEDGNGDKPRRASLTSDDDPATIDLARALQLLSLPRTVGLDPESGAEIVANFGRYGPYVKRGEEFRSLPHDAAVFSVTLDEALELLRQPRVGRRASTRTVLGELGAHPESGAPVRLLDGRYGPYVTDGTTNASIPKQMRPDDVTLEAAVDMLRARAESGSSRRPRRGSARGSSSGTRKAGRKRSA